MKFSYELSRKYNLNKSLDNDIHEHADETCVCMHTMELTTAKQEKDNEIWYNNLMIHKHNPKVYPKVSLSTH
jgi:hypothetical protein